MSWMLNPEDILRFSLSHALNLISRISLLQLERREAVELDVSDNAEDEERDNEGERYCQDNKEGFHKAWG